MKKYSLEISNLSITQTSNFHIGPQQVQINGWYIQGALGKEQRIWNRPVCWRALRVGREELADALPVVETARTDEVFSVA